MSRDSNSESTKLFMASKISVPSGYHFWNREAAFLTCSNRLPPQVAREWFPLSSDAPIIISKDPLKFGSYFISFYPEMNFQ